MEDNEINKHHVVHAMSGGFDSLRNLLYLVHHKVPLIKCVYVSIPNCNVVKTRKELQSINRTLTKVRDYITSTGQDTEIIFKHCILPRASHVGKTQQMWIAIGLSSHINAHTVALSFGAERGSMGNDSFEKLCVSSSLGPWREKLPIFTPFDDEDKANGLAKYRKFLPHLSTCESSSPARYCRSCKKCFQIGATIAGYLLTQAPHETLDASRRNTSIRDLTLVFKGYMKKQPGDSWVSHITEVDGNTDNLHRDNLNALFDNTLF